MRDGEEDDEHREIRRRALDAEGAEDVPDLQEADEGVLVLKKYDQHCIGDPPYSYACGWVGEIFAEPGTHPPCPRCYGKTERIYLSGYGVIGDEIPGGLVVENLGHEPVKVYSKSELKLEAEKRGLVNKVQHVGSAGSDKNPHTTRWL